MSEPQTSALDANSAADAFLAMMEPVEEPEERQVEAESTESEPIAETEEQTPEYTVKVDGKELKVTLDELVNGYQRQSDYTKKTTEAAETRKAADAEFQKAQAERQEYSERLNQFSQLLGAQLQEQNQTNWAELLESDPVEYLKQQHLYQQRQAQLYQAQQEQQKLYDLSQQEQQKAYDAYVKAEESSLLDKIPSWKDATVATAEKAEIRDYLKERGFSDKDISQVADHRQVLLIREAMNFAKLMKQAPDATKKVEKTPVKVERPGVSETNPLDGRTRAMQKLSKSGRVEDAAEVFAQILG